MRSFVAAKTLLPRGHYCLGFIAILSGNYCTLILLQSSGMPTGSSLAEPQGSLKVLDITSESDSELIKKEKNLLQICNIQKISFLSLCKDKAWKELHNSALPHEECNRVKKANKT